MKIGIDVRLWNESGIGRYTRNLVKVLSEIDRENTYYLFCLASDLKTVRSYVQAKNFQVVVANFKWHSIREQYSFPKLLNKYELDLMHFPYFSVPVFYNRPYVVTIHDLIIDHHPTGRASTLGNNKYFVKRMGYKFIVKKAAKRAVRIITVSEATKKEIERHLKISPRKILVTHEGIDMNFQNRQNKTKNKNYLLYVGNAYPHKNLEMLLSAYREMKEKPNLVLVGKEDYFYERLKKEYKDCGANFLHKLSDLELCDLYSNALAYIAPSKMEGFGLPVLEAMHSRCLVIASDIPAHREITGGNALFFKNKQQLKSRIAYVQQNYPGLSDVRQTAYNESKKYSWKKMGKETLKLYQKALKESLK